MIDLSVGASALVLTTDLILGWTVRSNQQGDYIFQSLDGGIVRFVSGSDLVLSLL